MDVDEKDQIMMTNVWLNLVSINSLHFYTFNQKLTKRQILSRRYINNKGGKDLDWFNWPS